jgi:hypothetical protein
VLIEVSFSNALPVLKPRLDTFVQDCKNALGEGEKTFLPAQELASQLVN